MAEWIVRVDIADVPFWRKFLCPYCGDWQTIGKTPYCPYCGKAVDVDG